MKKKFLLFGSIVVYCGLYASNSFAEAQVRTKLEKTQVVIIGTMHQFHHKIELYKPEILKQIIVALKPDAILNELPLSLVDSTGRPLHRDYHNSPEGWASDQAATELGIKQIPFDRPDRQENFKKTRYWERGKRYGEIFEKWQNQVVQDDPNSEDLKIIQLLIEANLAQMHLGMINRSRPEIINSEAFDKIIKIKHTLQYDTRLSVWEKYPNYKVAADDCKFFANQWRERNKIMANNILKTTKEYPGKRLVILAGAEHRYVLRDLLKDEPCIEFKEYWELIEPDKVKSEKREQVTIERDIK